MSEQKTKEQWSADAEGNAKRKAAAEAHGFGVVSPAERVAPPAARAAATVTPIALLEMRTLATSCGEPCKKCKKALPCNIVRVEKGQVIKVGGMPFVVGVRSDFEMCCRCGSFFFHKPNLNSDTGSHAFKASPTV